VQRAFSSRLDCSPAALPEDARSPIPISSPIPSFYHQLLPFEVVMKGYMVLAKIAEEREHFDDAVELLHGTFAVAQRSFGWTYNSTPEDVPTSSHPFFLALLHQMVALYRRLNWHEHAAGYCHAWGAIARKFHIAVFHANELQLQLTQDNYGAKLRSVQANELLFRNLMQSAFSVPAPLTYYSSMEIGSSRTFMDVFKFLTPFAWHNQLKVSKKVTLINPTDAELLSLTRWMEAMHFQDTLDSTINLEGTIATSSLPLYGGMQINLDTKLASLVPIHNPILLGSEESRTKAMRPAIVQDHTNSLDGRRLYEWGAVSRPRPVVIEYNTDVPGDAIQHHIQAIAYGKESSTTLVATRDGAVYVGGYMSTMLGVPGKYVEQSNGE
jgi:hypothetical protein